MMSTAEAPSAAADNGGSRAAGQVSQITLRIRVPATKVESCLHFDPGCTVHAAKMRALDQLGSGLTDQLNYGLYLPDSRGRAGKFLQEERLLSDYPLAGPVGDVELRYKSRIYRNPSLSMNKIKRANTNSHMKHFIQALQSGDTTAVNMHLSGGLDPNVRSRANGATILMLAAELKRSREMILTLISGGAFLDYRDAKGQTAMHLAASIGNAESVQTLLDLGQSPNCLDARGLTPLYHSILNCGSTVVAEMLLYDGASLGISDEKGLCEIHQACKLGREHHLELLLIYGAEINCLTAHGNTPLHVSALANQLECARILLRRGANKTLKNYEGLQPEDSAKVAGNQRLVDLIRDFSPAEVAPITVQPRLNNRRRRTSTSSSSSISGSQSLSHNGRGWGSLASIGAAQYQQQQQQEQQQQPTHSNAVRSQSTVFERDYSIGRMSLSSASSASFGSISNASSSRSSLIFPAGLNYLPAEQLPRSVVIQKSAKGGGFGFVLKSGRSAVPAGWGQQATHSRQILGRIEPGKPAFLAGMREGDLVLEINGVDVREFNHIECLRLITGDTLAMKLLTPPPPIPTPPPTVREGHSQSVLSVESETGTLRAIDMLDRTINGFEDIPEDPPQAQQPSPPASVSGSSNSSAAAAAVPATPPSTVAAATAAASAAFATHAATNSAEEKAKIEKVESQMSDVVSSPSLIVGASDDPPPSEEDERNDDVLPVPDGFGNEVELQQLTKDNDHLLERSTMTNSARSEDSDEQSPADRKISFIAPLPARAPPPAPPAPPPPPPPPPPKPSIGEPSTAASAAIIRRRSLLARPAAATPDHDQELRRLVEMRRRKIDSGQIDPRQQIEAELNRKSAGSRMVIVPASTAAATAAQRANATASPMTAPAPIASPAAEAPAAGTNGTASSSPVQLRKSVGPLAVVAASESANSQRPSSFTGKAEQLRQMIIQQQHQQQQQQQQQHQQQQQQQQQQKQQQQPQQQGQQTRQVSEL